MEKIGRSSRATPPAYTGIPEFGHWFSYFPKRDFACCEWSHVAWQYKIALHSLPPRSPSEGSCSLFRSAEEWALRICSHIHLIIKMAFICVCVLLRFWLLSMSSFLHITSQQRLLLSDSDPELVWLEHYLTLYLWRWSFEVYDFTAQGINS